MTLVIGCVTAGIAVSVADRRLTWLNGPSVRQTITDYQNKAVVVCNRLAFAYTGLAEIGELKTDDWLLETVARVNPYNPKSVCEAIAEHATSAFKSIALPAALKRHAFLGVGWARFGRSAPFSPLVVRISNALDRNGRWVARPESRFRIDILPLSPRRKFDIAAVGQDLTAGEVEMLSRTIHTMVSRSLSPKPFVRVLAEAVWRVAQRNPAVGTNLNVVYLPPPNASMLAGLSVPLGIHHAGVTATALYLPGEDMGETIYLPSYTCQGMTYKDGFVRPGRPDDRGLNASQWWEDCLLVLSKRNAGPSGQGPVQPDLAIMCRLPGWGLFAEFQRFPFETPSPCIVRTKPIQSVLEWLRGRAEFMVIFSSHKPHEGVAEHVWVAALRQWLLDAQIPAPLVDNFIASLGTGTYRSLAERLRAFFHDRGDD